MNPKILVVLSPPRRSELLELLEGKNLQINLASDFREAVQKLSGRTSYDLLVADEHLLDGSWRELAQFLFDSGKPCEMIVCSRRGDEQLWAEVLQCGVYDLLVEPFERQEVHRIIESAIDSRYMRHCTQRMAAAS